MLAAFIAPLANADKGISCEQFSELAESIMVFRQEGSSIVEAMKIAGENEGIRSIVISAYKKNQYQTDEYRKRAITDFGNEYYLVCVEARKG